ncbi:phosphonate ABC transporter, permease protein PhnE [Salinibius halmophilus]|uniref:phosphonate ABC transporter, permease protein PhnE n=1 Tax=Salinibius halmophilus TaxID=1853216 RepID=UPI000E6652F4|nr:phosphonate ABC transporter, permease protein PhnE [Salinibius halmophilus]
MPNATPQRFAHNSLWHAGAFTFAMAVLAWALYGTDFSISRLIAGVPNMWTITGEMLPPDTSRFNAIVSAIITTLQMAIAGAAIGIALSIPIGFLAAKNTTPHPWLYRISRAWLTMLRTVPDLAWALFFVASVGLGPFAGVLTLIVDTVGFCGRFFAEAIEETDPQPNEALAAIGAKPVDRFAVAILPNASASMVNTSLFSLEKAVRSSVVLGLVGAGGIGVELAVSMEMFRYDQASMIILLVFLLVYGVERISNAIRTRIL